MAARLWTAAALLAPLRPVTAARAPVAQQWLAARSRLAPALRRPVAPLPAADVPRFVSVVPKVVRTASEPATAWRRQLAGLVATAERLGWPTLARMATTGGESRSGGGSGGGAGGGQKQEGGANKPPGRFFVGPTRDATSDG